MLPPFELLTPRSLAEAVEMLAARPEALPLSGGTSLLVDCRGGRVAPSCLLDLSRVEELRGIERSDDALTIGAATTIAEISSDPSIAEHAGILREAATAFANPLVRNRATIGGNLAYASPAADCAPPLLALGAEVELGSARETRAVPLHAFFLGVRSTVREPTELLTAIRVPLSPDGARAGYRKLGLRKADAISVVSAAVWAKFTGRTCDAARIALGAVAPVPLRATSAEAALTDDEMTDEAIREAARLAAATVRPIDDVRASAAYRRRVVEVLVRRLLRSLAASREGERCR